jgi:hypothetical protein
LAKKLSSKNTKANALLCPCCCVEYVNIELDLEIEGEVLRNVKALRCPCCGEEQFSPNQLEAVSREISKVKSKF